MVTSSGSLAYDSHDPYIHEAGWVTQQISTLTAAAGLEGFGLSSVWVGVRLSP